MTHRPSAGARDQGRGSAAAGPGAPASEAGDRPAVARPQHPRPQHQPERQHRHQAERHDQRGRLGQRADRGRGDQPGGVRDGGDARDRLARVRAAAPGRREGERYDHGHTEAEEPEAAHCQGRVRRRDHEQPAERREGPAEPYGPDRAEAVDDLVAA